jgi:hypothetical protein
MSINLEAAVGILDRKLEAGVSARWITSIHSARPFSPDRNTNVAD